MSENEISVNENIITDIENKLKDLNLKFWKIEEFILQNKNNIKRKIKIIKKRKLNFNKSTNNYFKIYNIIKLVGSEKLKNKLTDKLDENLKKTYYDEIEDFKIQIKE